MILHIHASAAEASRALAERVLQVAGEVSGFVNIALSGGSTPALFFRLWASEYGAGTRWERFRFFWVDERCVPPEDAQSNYGMTKRSLLDLAPIPPEQVFRIHGENDPAAEALRYSLLAEGLVPAEGGVPMFDIVLLGIGDDGHTASIFPGQEALLTAPQPYSVGIRTPGGQRRVTLTGRPLLQASHPFFLVSGKGKAKVLADVYASPQAGPAAYVAHHALHPVEIFTDADAAALLPESGKLVPSTSR